MHDFIQGMGYLFRGARHLTTPGVKRFIFLPILFNFLLFVGLFYLLYHYLFPFTDYYINQLPAWLSFLHGVFFVILFISTFLFFLSVFTVLFNIVAAPFNGLLAERAQLALFKSSIPAISFTQIAIRSIKRQLQFLGYFLPRFIAVLLLFFVPLTQPFYPFIWFFFNAWMLSVQYQDFAMDNNLNSFREMQDQINQYKLLSLGFGSIINLASFVPLLNILTMPAAVIGSVLLYCERNLDEKKTSIFLDHPN